MTWRDVGWGVRGAFPGLLSSSQMGKEGWAGGGRHQPGGQADDKEPGHTSKGWGTNCRSIPSLECPPGTNPLSLFIGKSWRTGTRTFNNNPHLDRRTTVTHQRPSSFTPLNRHPHLTDLGPLLRLINHSLSECQRLDALISGGPCWRFLAPSTPRSLQGRTDSVGVPTNGSLFTGSKARPGAQPAALVPSLPPLLPDPGQFPQKCAHAAPCEPRNQLTGFQSEIHLP